MQVRAGRITLPGMVGRIYLEGGKQVTVLARWSGRGRPAEAPGVTPAVIWRPPRGGAKYKQAPRNVEIQRADGSHVVRPFRGLRRGS
jgi:hypothetical protein